MRICMTTHQIFSLKYREGSEILFLAFHNKANTIFPIHIRTFLFITVTIFLIFEEKLLKWCTLYSFYYYNSINRLGTLIKAGDGSLAKGKEIKHILKVLLLGDGAVGKTSLILRFIENKFREEYSMSLGVDFLTKTVKFIDTKDVQRTVSLQVWDIAGQARHVSYSHLYLKGALGAFYVFDLTRRETLLNMQERWQSQVLKVSPKCLSILIGNKADLKQERAFTSSQTKRIQKAMHVIDYVETSAKTGQNVNEAFQTMTTRILNLTAKKYILDE